MSKPDGVLSQIAKLKAKYQDGQVSVLVGAGFSMNACQEYPSWNGLLEDMAVNLYRDEIEKAYLQYKEINPANKMSLDVFIKREYKNVIARVGYLRMVSEYIRRLGYREAIEHYIEERVPYIDEDKQEFRFAGKNKDKVIPVRREDFSAHVKLLSGEHWVRIYTTNYDRLLEYAKQIGGKKYTVITKARQLSDNSGPSIIKLHGDLHHPSEEPRKFIFDGNPHQQYIISEEDYKNYPKDHEAFTQLMRISLLQGVFCLIGFSGDDPNFLNWINWVRDVLVTDDEAEKEPKESKYKIFLIGMSENEPDAAKSIFYENHNIYYIPFLSNEVKELIGAEPSDDTRELFCKFFDYLETKEPGQHEEMRNGRGYIQLWSGVCERKIKGNLPNEFPRTTTTIDEEKLEQLWNLRRWNRFVANSYYQRSYLQDVLSKDSLTTTEARLAILAIRDSGYIVDEKLYNLIAKSGVDVTLFNEFQKYARRTETLCFKGEGDNGDVEGYEAILRQLLLLDFGKAKELTKAWQPAGIDVLKKAVLLFFLNEEGWKELLLEFSKTEVDPKELYYAARLQNMLEGRWSPEKNLERFENANIQDYLKLSSDLVKHVTENKEKIGKYGDGKNEKVIYFGSKPNKKPEALMVLNFLLEAPLMVSFRNFYVMISAGSWYKVHQQLFEAFPFPFLFYSLQCTDKKIRTRIGQDYAYSDHLVGICLDKILARLLTALLADTTPPYLKESIMGIAKEMFVSVKPGKWEPQFAKVWEEIVLKYRFTDVKDRLFEGLDTFVFKALYSMKSRELRQRIITDVVSRVKTDHTFTINCLYYLHVVPTDSKGNVALKNLIDEFVDSISDPYEVNVAGNLHRILTEEQKGKVAEKCAELLSKEKIPDLVYQTSQFFVKDDKEKRQLFITSVCRNPLLWNNGVMENGQGMTDFHYLKLSRYTKRIHFDRDALVVIYEKMKASANKLLGYVDIHGSMSFIADVDGLLSEMVTFMNAFKSKLKTQPDYDSVYETINKAYHQISGFGSVEEGLLSEYEQELKNALSFIQANSGVFAHKEILDYVNVILNRILLRNSDGLDTCIAYLRLFLNEGLIGNNDTAIMEGLLSVLNRYDKTTAQNCNMDLVLTTQNMAKIGKTLKKFGCSSDGIDYWIGLQASGRFMTNF